MIIEKVSRYTVLKDFSLGLEATPSIQHQGSEVDLTEEQASKFKEFVELVPGFGDRTYVVVKRDAKFEGKDLKVGDKVILSPGDALLLGSKVIDVEDELDKKEKKDLEKE